MPIGSRDTVAVTTTQRDIDLQADGGSVLVDLNIASSWDGTVDFQATIDGANYFNIRYLELGTLTPAESVSQLTGLSTKRYLLPGPLTQVRINCGAGTSGTLTAVYRVVPVGGPSLEVLVKEAVDNGLEVQGSVAHDAVAAGNEIPTAGYATSDMTGESDVAAGDRVRHLATMKGVHLFSQVTRAASLTDGIGASSILHVVDDTDVEKSFFVAASNYIVGPDGSYDRLRSVGDTAGSGLGALMTSPTGHAHNSVTGDEQILAAAGKLHTITIHDITTGGVITVYDNTAESGVVIATLTLAAGEGFVSLHYDVDCATGLYIGYDASVVGALTVSYSV